jgi:hypothetical protein
MRLTPRRVTGQRAWWLDVVVSLVAVGTVQGLVMLGVALFEDPDRTDGGGGPGFESALVLERAPGRTDPSQRVGALTVTLGGEVSELYPGASVELELEVRNPAQVDIHLDLLTVTVGIPDRDGCPASALLVGTTAGVGGGSAALDLVLGPSDGAILTIPITMITGAPSACQGATFPLAYRAQGSLP